MQQNYVLEESSHSEKRREIVEGQERTHAHYGHAEPWLCGVNKYFWTCALSMLLVLALTLSNCSLSFIYLLLSRYLFIFHSIFKSHL